MKKLVFILFLVLVGCNDVKTVKFYTDNPEIAKKRNAQCEKEQLSQDNVDCQNAKKAVFKAKTLKSWGW